ncbi:MAG: hypothetical protein ACE5IW_05985 [bacterium]
MEEKWRKFTAIFLTCALLFLSISAEFSHQHSSSQNGQPNLTKSENEVYEIETSQIHSFICLACLYGLTKLAPDLSFQTLKPNQESLLTTFRESTFYFIILPTPYYLRAPPVA